MRKPAAPRRLLIRHPRCIDSPAWTKSLRRVDVCKIFFSKTAGSRRAALMHSKWPAHPVSVEICDRFVARSSASQKEAWKLFSEVRRCSSSPCRRSRSLRTIRQGPSGPCDACPARGGGASSPMPWQGPVARNTTRSTGFMADWPGNGEIVRSPNVRDDLRHQGPRNAVALSLAAWRMIPFDRVTTGRPSIPRRSGILPGSRRVRSGPPRRTGRGPQAGSERRARCPCAG